MLVYLGIVFGVALEGEVTLLAAAFAAHRSLFAPSHVLIAAVVGTLIADWTCFFVGRFSKSGSLPFKRMSAERLEIPLRWMSEKRLLLIFFYRYFYGARTAILVLFGHSQMPTPWFLICSSVAIILWASIVFSIGYFLGAVIAAYAPSIMTLPDY